MKMSDSELGHFTSFSVDSMKVIAESIGISNLGEDAAKELADDVTYRLRVIIQDAVKFMNHSKRQELCMSDIDHSLKIKNIEPQYGFIQKDSMSFRFASGGGRELFFTEEKELDLTEILSAPSPKIPLDVSVRAHWLSVDGVQPTIPENPPPLSKDAQKLESVDPISKLSKTNSKDSAGKPICGKAARLKVSENVHVKQLATHELSVEQQLYYKEITEACVGSDEGRRAEALQSLACDPGLHEMLPRMCTFISEGVKVNVVQNNLALLIYLMRMVKALLDNQSLYLEKYLHELIPSVSTCIVARQLCLRPEMDNHWALRDFAARLMAQICKTFNTSTNNLQTRVTRLFAKALQCPSQAENEGGAGMSTIPNIKDSDKTPLASLYGAIQGLAELGPEVVKVLIVPRVRWLGERIESALSGTERLAAGNLKHQLVKVLAPVIRLLRHPPDLIEEYKQEYGYLGPSLQQMVSKLRTSPGGAGPAPLAPPPVPAAPHAPSPAPPLATPTVRIVERAPATAPSASPGPQPAAPLQKFVIVTSQHKPLQAQPASTTGHVVVQGSQPVIRTQTMQSMVVSSGPGASGAGGVAQKVVVVSAAPHAAAAPAATVAHSQAPVSVVSKTVVSRAGGAGEAPTAGGAGPTGPPEPDDLSHLA